MSTPKTAVILVNIGTPYSPAVADIKKYLSEFLNDPRVIDLPYLLRKFLVNFIIVPFRAKKSAKLYQQMWTEKGSPLMFHGKSLEQKLASNLGNEYVVKLAMNYQSPNLTTVLEDLLKLNLERIIIFPLFPQYASSTIGSINEKAMQFLAKQTTMPSVDFISKFYDSKAYQQALATSIEKYNWQQYDHILFSYHGLPLNQIHATHNNKSCTEYNCEHEINAHNQWCYHAQCYATSRAITEQLNIPKHKYSVAFQSRFASKWLSPFTDDVIKEKANEGCKKLLVISPAFTADCLETLIEIDHEYRELFIQHGGELFTLAESLNDSDVWVDAIKQIITTK